jgi:hypothetical protein
MMADNQLLNDNNGGDGGDDDIFVYTGGDQEVPRDVKRVRIAENVDTILASTFRQCFQLIEVEGHNKMQKIESIAFHRCTRLRRMSKMTCVIEIEADAFNHCLALSELELDKLEIIGHHAFCYCKSLRSINMPSIRRVGHHAFYGCDALTDVVFGQDLERFETNSGTFLYCTALRRIAIPLKDNIFLDNDSYGIQSFYGCENLSRVDVIGGIHKTISSLHLESWRNEMRNELEAEIDTINQTLPNIPAIEKTKAIKQWITRVLNRMEHYKTEHQTLLKEAMVLLELALWKANLQENEADDAAAAQEGVRVTRGQRKRARKDRCITSGASIVIKNVLPFLALE